VTLDKAIKTIGLFAIPVVLHPEVKVNITVNVARSEDEAERQARGEDVLAEARTESGRSHHRRRGAVRGRRIQIFGRLQDARPHGSGMARDRGGCERPWPRRARSLSCSKAWPSRWRQRSRARWRFPPSASAPPRNATDRSSSWRTCWASIPNPPKFVREYAKLGADIEAAVKAYADDVRSRRFPGVENVYPMKRIG
jgi:hypothetical protein